MKRSTLLYIWQWTFILLVFVGIATEAKDFRLKYVASKDTLSTAYTKRFLHGIKASFNYANTERFLGPANQVQLLEEELNDQSYSQAEAKVKSWFNQDEVFGLLGVNGKDTSTLFQPKVT
jgi:hypothetical protein